MQNIQNNYINILNLIQKYQPKYITPQQNLVAITKTVPSQAIIALLKLGHRKFGENKVQEALTKYPSLRETYQDIELHLVGGLQSNKVKQALLNFDVIESLDRAKLADLFDHYQKETGIQREYYIQINIGNEPQKNGIKCEELSDFLAYCTKDLRLNVTGLMCIPPADIAADSYFAKMQKLAQQHRLRNLSMGMSDSFIAALKYGATTIRLGSAIFGSRAQ